MVSYLSWAANAVLFVLACFLAANTANTIFAAMLAPPAVDPTPHTQNVATQRGSASAHQAILTRNLFASSTIEAPPPSESTEDIEATNLPLDLLGTAAADDPDLAWAAVMDRELNATLVVGIGDRLKEKADVVRIERRRLVLRENGAHRELTFGDEGPVNKSVRRAPRRSRSNAKRPTRNRRQITREQVDEVLKDPTDLLAQARFLPKYDGQEMIGFQVNAIKQGSVLQDVGLQNGDIIKEFNGIAINNAQDSAKLLQELSEAKRFSILVDGPNGTRPIDVDLEAE